jgi:hypothetical protein
MPKPWLKPPWKPGQSGNPDGRPKKKPLSISYEKLVTAKIPHDHAIVRQVPWLKGKSWADAIAYGQVLEGAKGGTPAAKEIADRVEGAVVRTLAGPDGEALFPNRDEAEARALELLAAARARAKK